MIGITYENTSAHVRVLEDEPTEASDELARFGKVTNTERKMCEAYLVHRA
jgi:hypothetical protein